MDALIIDLEDGVVNGKEALVRLQKIRRMALKKPILLMHYTSSYESLVSTLVPRARTFEPLPMSGNEFRNSLNGIAAFHIYNHTTTVITAENIVPQLCC
jgi:hypothetical protein